MTNHRPTTDTVGHHDHALGMAEGEGLVVRTLPTDVAGGYESWNRDGRSALRHRPRAGHSDDKVGS